MRSPRDYVAVDRGRFSAQLGSARVLLDAGVRQVAFTGGGTLVATRDAGNAVELDRVASDGGMVRLIGGLARPDLVVGGEWVVVKQGSSLVLVDTHAQPAAPRSLSLNPEAFDREHARLSPDDSRLLLLDRGALSVTDVATGITRPIAAGLSDYGSPIGWTWSGDALVYGRSSSQRDRSAHLYRVDVGTGSQTNLWTGDWGDLSLPTGTPHGVVFEFLPRGTEKETLGQYWFVPATGGQSVIFMTGGLGLSVSRDGTMFSFSRTVPGSVPTGAYIAGLP